MHNYDSFIYYRTLVNFMYKTVRNMFFVPNIDIKLFYSGRFNGFGSGGGSKKVRLRNNIFSRESQMCRKFGQKMTFVHKYVVLLQE